MRNFRRRPGGLTKKTTEVQDEEFLAIARNNPLWSSAKILHATDIPVSTKTKTVRRRLKQAGLTCYKAAKVVQFTEEHAQMRREFALQNLNENWESTVFADEKCNWSFLRRRSILFSRIGRRIHSIYQKMYLVDKSCDINFVFVFMVI
ncbi:Transposase [Popillia japonica]|uniref:Transposase n=1 Tax=Popillia japonica TaxID=7064 RepID=A0AAW1JGC2_POPJA